MAFTGAQKPAPTATALLALDQSQIAQYLKKNDDIEGGFVLSNFDGVENLSDGQQDKLERKLRAAADGLTASQPFQIDELFTRLTSVTTREQDDSLDRRLSRPPAETFESAEATPPPITILEAEASSYRELIRVGGRPVCSIEDLSHLLTNPTVGYKMLRPWLSDHPGSKDEEGDIKTLFSRQLARWWSFHKSQWDNRGKSDSDEGFSAYLEARRRRYDGMGAHEMTSSSSFETTIRRQWQQKRASPEFRVPDHQVFPLYRDAVKRRLARHDFARTLKLKKDPRQQTEWTNWLEYVGYEQLWLDKQTAVAESLEEQSHQAWKKLLQARRPPSGEVSSSHDMSATVGSARSLQSRQCRPGGKAANLSKGLEAARAELDATGRMIDDLIQETKRYRQARTAAYYQRLRVEWAVEEARLMETEMSQQRKAAKSSTKPDREDKKRRRRPDDGEEEEEEDNIPKPRSKRTRHGGSTKDAVSDSSQGYIRRSKRLAKIKTKV